MPLPGGVAAFLSSFLDALAIETTARSVVNVAELVVDSIAGSLGPVTFRQHDLDVDAGKAIKVRQSAWHPSPEDVEVLAQVIAARLLRARRASPSACGAAAS